MWWWWWWWSLIWHLAVLESCWFQTTVEPPLTANSPQWPPLYNGHRTYLCPGRQAINCFLFKPLNNGHLLTTATVPLKHVPNCQFFQWVMKKSRMIMTFDPYYALMINRGNHILIVFHVYCCSKHKLIIVYDTFANVANLAHFVMFIFWSRTLPKFICVFYFYMFIKYDWITIMRYSKRKINTSNKLYYYINKTNARWAFVRNMISSCVKISSLLRLHNKSHLSHQKSIKVKWFGISLVFI